MTQVVGWYNHDNIGDESYKLSIPKLFPNQEFTFDDPYSIPDSSCLLLGGGNILEKYYLEKVANCNVENKITFSVSATANTPLNLLSTFNQIFVRDEWSVNWLHANGIQCEYTPDASTILTGDRIHGSRLIETLFKEVRHDLYAKKVGIVLNSYLFAESDSQLTRDFINFQKVCSDLAKTIDSTNASFIFFPMSTGMPQDDRVTNSWLANLCKFWKKNVVVYDKLSVEETINLISACDAVISTRLHSTIFAVNNCVPFLDITHHDKNKAFLSTWGLEESSFSYWNFDNNHFNKSLKFLLDNEGVYNDKLKQIHQQQLQLLKRGIEHVYFSK